MRLRGVLASIGLAASLVLLPAGTGSAGHCMTVPGPTAIAWSPDGASLAAILHEGSCTTSDAWISSAGRLQKLESPNQSVARGVSWAPDGRRIAIGYNKAPSDELVVYDFQERTRTTIAPGGFDPAWSPDGRLIAFASARQPGIHTVAADGTGLRRIASGEQPAWSPDSRKLSYHRDGSIYVADVDDGDEQRVAAGVWATWAPGGSSLSVTRVEGSYLVALDGSGEQRLGPGHLVQWLNGGREALLSNRGVLWLLSVQTGDTRRLAEDIVGGALNPQRDRLATVVASGRRSEVYVAEPTGARPSRITPTQCPLYTSRCVHGTDAADRIRGTAQRDVIFPGAGDDRVWTGAGHDRIDTAYGRDFVDAGPGNDIVSAQGNDDRIFGRAGIDNLHAGDGEDVVDGGSGRDFITVHGDRRMDRVHCGPGRDWVLADDVDRIGRDCERVTREP
jgi:dipeptidyl aminopeptidase/acylaminoacyl peptidase